MPSPPRHGSTKHVRIFASACLRGGLLLALVAAAHAQPSRPADANETSLPRARATREYRAQLPQPPEGRATRWRLMSGRIPEGLELDERTGVIFGKPQAAGEFRFVLACTTDARREVLRPFRLLVAGLLNIEWLPGSPTRGRLPAEVLRAASLPENSSADGIAGRVKVTSYSADAVDLTVVIMAVAENGRATALGYQRLRLDAASGETGVEQVIPFGATLPFGKYSVHADAVGEVAARKAIYRTRVETPAPLELAPHL
jgi:Putative Ig domain